MFATEPYGLEEMLARKGDGSNMLRTETFCQPRALRPGDWLITGDRILAYPEVGRNSSVIIWLTGGHEGHRLNDLAPRLALALAPADCEPPPNNSCQERGHNLFRSSGMCARCGAGDPITHPCHRFEGLECKRPEKCSAVTCAGYRLRSEAFDEDVQAAFPSDAPRDLTERSDG